MSSDPFRAIVEQSRAEIEDVIAGAERELAELEHRRGELRAIIARGRAMLGDQAAPSTRNAAAGPDGDLTLHEAISRVLDEHGGDWLSVASLTDEINRRALYRKRDGTPIAASQVHARAKHYPHLFEKRRTEVRMKPDSGGAA